MLPLVMGIGRDGSGWPNGKFKRSIIIGLDGVGGYYLKNITREQTPVLWSFLESRGSCSDLLSRAEYPTASAPNWASVLTGMSPAETGILRNDWHPTALHPETLTDGRVPPVSGQGHIPPTIFAVAKKYSKNIKTAYLYSWAWMRNLVDENVDYTYMNENDGYTAGRLIDQLLSEEPPHLTFIQLSAVDNAGHASYWGSPKYYEALRLQDKFVGNIVGSLQKSPLAEETLVVITSDHGGWRAGHHSYWMLPTTQIPIILHKFGGRTAKACAKKLAEPWNIKDVAPTVLGAMGIPVTKYQRGQDHSYLL